jgi:hypothetical protein
MNSVQGSRFINGDYINLPKSNNILYKAIERRIQLRKAKKFALTMGALYYTYLILILAEN